MREYAVAVCKQETVLVKFSIQKLSRSMICGMIGHIDTSSVRNC